MSREERIRREKEDEVKVIKGGWRRDIRKKFWNFGNVSPLMIQKFAFPFLSPTSTNSSFVVITKLLKSFLAWNDSPSLVTWCLHQHRTKCVIHLISCFLFSPAFYSDPPLSIPKWNILTCIVSTQTHNYPDFTLAFSSDGHSKHLAQRDEMLM